MDVDGSRVLQRQHVSSFVVLIALTMICQSLHPVVKITHQLWMISRGWVAQCNFLDTQSSSLLSSLDMNSGASVGHQLSSILLSPKYNSSPEHFQNLVFTPSCTETTQLPNSTSPPKFRYFIPKRQRSENSMSGTIYRPPTPIIGPP